MARAATREDPHPLPPLRRLDAAPGGASEWNDAPSVLVRFTRSVS